MRWMRYYLIINIKNIIHFLIPQKSLTTSNPNLTITLMSGSELGLGLEVRVTYLYHRLITHLGFVERSVGFLFRVRVSESL